LSSELLSENVRVNMYRNRNLHVLYESFKEEHRLRVFENRVLRRRFGL
jgi:hypothetical protein